MHEFLNALKSGLYGFWFCFCILQFRELGFVVTLVILKVKLKLETQVEHRSHVQEVLIGWVYDNLKTKKIILKMDYNTLN